MMQKNISGMGGVRSPAALEHRPSGVGTKFNADGTVRRFPGNTIICHLPQDSPLRPMLIALYTALASSPMQNLYTLLPPVSWHMTIFEGVCDEIRKPGFWPSDIPLDAPLTDCSALFAKKLRASDLVVNSSYRMKLERLQFSNGITLRLEPIDQQENANLRQLRDRLSELLRIRQPEHDTYGFHLSIAYMLRRPLSHELQALSQLSNEYLELAPEIITLNRPEFCSFDDMLYFHRQFFI